jgi:hypothetical protein
VLPWPPLPFVTDVPDAIGAGCVSAGVISAGVMYGWNIPFFEPSIESTRSIASRSASDKFRYSRGVNHH